MKIGILILLIFGISDLTFGQIKSERQVKYSLNKDTDEKGFHNNISKDSCIIFWKEYNEQGKVTKEYDFPSDRCWKINGPWEHHYFYDKDNRITEHRDFGGEEGQERVLMRNHFFSYPHLQEPNKANELLVVYNFAANTKTEQQTVDTFQIDTINTKYLIDHTRTYWKFDTIINDQGNFIFREDFRYDKDLFNPIIIEALLNKQTVKEFEIALLANIAGLSEKLQEIHSKEKLHSLDFVFEEKSKRREIQIRTTENFVNIGYRFINKAGNNDLTFNYEYNVNGNKLAKEGFVKFYIDCY